MPNKGEKLFLAIAASLMLVAFGLFMLMFAEHIWFDHQKHLYELGQLCVKH